MWIVRPELTYACLLGPDQTDQLAHFLRLPMFSLKSSCLSTGGPNGQQGLWFDVDCHVALRFACER